MVSSRTFSRDTSSILAKYSEITGVQLGEIPDKLEIYSKIAYAVAHISGVDPIGAAALAMASAQQFAEPNEITRLNLLSYCIAHKSFSKGANRKAEFAKYIRFAPDSDELTWDAYFSQAEYEHRDLMCALVVAYSEAPSCAEYMQMCEAWLTLAQHALQIVEDMSRESHLHLDRRYLAKSSYGLTLRDFRRVGTAEVLMDMGEKELIRMIQATDVRSSCIDRVLAICAHLESDVLKLQDLKIESVESAMRFLLITLSEYVRDKLQEVFI